MPKGKKTEKPFKVNGYTIQYSNFWGNYSVSHPNIGNNIGTFKYKKDAITFAKRG